MSFPTMSTKIIQWSRVPLFLMGVLILVALVGPLPAAGQTAEDCLDCHEDEDLTKNVDGRVISLFVDIDKFNKSIHGLEDVGCIDCHADLEDFLVNMESEGLIQLSYPPAS